MAPLIPGPPPGKWRTFRPSVRQQDYTKTTWTIFIKTCWRGGDRGRTNYIQGQIRFTYGETLASADVSAPHRHSSSASFSFFSFLTRSKDRVFFFNPWILSLSSPVFLSLSLPDLCSLFHIFSWLFKVFSSLCFFFFFHFSLAGRKHEDQVRAVSSLRLIYNVSNWNLNLLWWFAIFFFLLQRRDLLIELLHYFRPPARRLRRMKNRSVGAAQRWDLPEVTASPENKYCYPNSTTRPSAAPSENCCVIK